MSKITIEMSEEEYEKYRNTKEVLQKLLEDVNDITNSISRQRKTNFSNFTYQQIDQAYKDTISKVIKQM